MGGGNPPNAIVDNTRYGCSRTTSWGGDISSTNGSIAVLERILGYGNYTVDATSQLWIRLGCQVSGNIPIVVLLELKMLLVKEQ